MSTLPAKLKNGFSISRKVWIWIIAIAIILIVGLVAFFTIRKALARAVEKRHISYTKDGGEVADDFDAEQYANEMFDVMDGVFTLANTKNNAAGDLMKLNDNELIAVHNYWNKHLYDRNQETLYKMMKAEYNVPDFVYGDNYWQQLLNRLSSLNLISK